MLVLFTMGCYTYAPMSLDAPPLPLGEFVRIEVTDDEAEHLSLADVLAGSATTIEGELASVRSDGMEVRVPVRDPTGRFVGDREVSQVIFVRQSGIMQLDRRQFSTSRTVIVATATAGLLLALFIPGLTGWVGGQPAMVGEEKD